MIIRDYFRNVDDAMAHCLANVMDTGTDSAPRGKVVRELIGQSVAFDMRYPLATNSARRLGYRFAPAEAAWILSGDNRLETIKRYSNFIWEFSDDGFFYSGAYGPKVVDQLTYVCDVLAEDHDTRQAVIEVWRPNPRKGRDIPCTLSYQLIAREGALHVIQSMRSSDVWLGYPYDAFNATMLAAYVILLLRDRSEKRRSPLCLGTHTMMVGSQHIYETNWARVTEYLACKDKVFECPRFDPFYFNSPSDLIDHLWALAAQDWSRVRPDGYLVKELQNTDIPRVTA